MKMADEISLDRLKPKQKGVIAKIKGSGALHRRLLDMGLVKGSPIEVEKVAPLGDPIDVKIKGYHLSLRKDEASNIIVEI